MEVLLVRGTLRQRYELGWQVDLVAAHHAASCWCWAVRSSASRTPKIALTRCQRSSLQAGTAAACCSAHSHISSGDGPTRNTPLHGRGATTRQHRQRGDLPLA